ncbi:MAG: NYN domain-containing protein [Planctomycetota bacterium]
MDGKRAAAVFVDFDNLYFGVRNNRFGKGRSEDALERTFELLDALRAQLREEGCTMLVGRAYSAFDDYPGSEAAHDLALRGFDPQYVLQNRGKNSADLQLSIDLLEVLLGRDDIRRFVVVGGDRDFIPISVKVLERGAELLIVALPESTSGDLLQRVGQECYVDAATLCELPPILPEDQRGAGTVPRRIEPLRPAADQEAGEDAPAQGGARVLGHVDPSRLWTSLPDVEALSPARLERCMELLEDLWVHYREKHGRSEVWLSPFLKREMADQFPELTHPQRRNLINRLKEQGRIRVEERESETGPHPYSVVTPGAGVEAERE